MQQISENLLVVNAGEPLPEGIEGALKIYLAGSCDIGPNQDFDWQGKFINGLATLAKSDGGLIMLKNQRFVIMNPRYVPQNPTPGIVNPEFVTMMNWKQDMMAAADAVFCNFLKKSVSPMPMFEFGCLCSSGKMVVRCPEEYAGYGTVKIVCERNQVPLFPGKIGTVPVIVQALYSYIPAFKTAQQLILPE